MARKVSKMSSLEGKPFSFKLSAPGKVILFGEYSVVFNKPAIAATLCLRTKLQLTETNSKAVQLSFSALNIEKNFDVETIKQHFEIRSTNTWESYVQSLTKAVELVYEKTYGLFDLTDEQKLSIIAFFHCFSKTIESSNGFHLKVDSELPVGSGVGSSASFSVALSAAVSLYEQYLKHSKDISEMIQKREDGCNMISEKFVNQISELAFSCEKIFHGSPSGVDHNTILQGSMLEFIKNENQNQMSCINTLPIKILLVNTNVARSTKKLVANFKLLRENHSEVINCVLNGMDCVAKSAVKDLRALKENQNETNRIEIHFGELISINHNLLRVIGASHPTLEKIVSIAQKYSLNAKLTGAGGGGFGFIYLPSNIDTPTINCIQKELSEEGFTPYEVTLGGPGLTIDEIHY